VSPRFTRIVPRLPVTDLARSVAFYRDVLGFRTDVLWPDDAPWFAILERDGVGVGLFVPTAENPVTAGYAELYIDVTDARLLHQRVKDRVAIEWGPEVYTYGRREFALRDPDGYLVIFSKETDDPPTTAEP
jgi:catechol 2,3-dioxygenase-like lactoylglutathione lyase family enzyme